MLYNVTIDDDSIQVPFPELTGEYVVYLGQTSDAILAISNFRLFIRFKESFVNVSSFLSILLKSQLLSFIKKQCFLKLAVNSSDFLAKNKKTKETINKWSQ